MRLLLFALLPLILALPASAQTESDVSAADRDFHERLIVLDTHLDIPERWDDASWDFAARHHVDWDGS
jgi:membrane dipeptidase